VTSKFEYLELPACKLFWCFESLALIERQTESLILASPLTFMSNSDLFCYRNKRIKKKVNAVTTTWRLLWQCYWGRFHAWSTPDVELRPSLYNWRKIYAWGNARRWCFVSKFTLNIYACNRLQSFSSSCLEPRRKYRFYYSTTKTELLCPGAIRQISVPFVCFRSALGTLNLLGTLTNVVSVWLYCKHNISIPLTVITLGGIYLTTLTRFILTFPCLLGYRVPLHTVSLETRSFILWCFTQIG